MNKVITIPNIISISRLFLGLPLLYAIHIQSLPHIIIIGSIVIISDYIDGFLSRLLNQRSALGQLIDPVVDFIIITSILIVMSINQIIPYWFLALIIFRYLFIFYILNRYKTLTKKTPKSIFSGKVCMCLVTSTTVLALVQSQFPNLYTLSMLLTVQLMILSAYDYFHTYNKTKN
ncbi:CDP-alcohol phosphatidyltransferase family protein [Candidatus Comchoanobacter bicostacola]|uniref:CDP-diacylglycerol--glycerol-3-phosphate 3-phosphatidyltransferase n=1 Tax=Candidatus Comchoanobacter bicostacola TaxID=2919598 RepID=A0ABY5DMX0_9GAMM|nr:CDP-alcohol phosphatidyltransferase family protein [Candidatus Comchoanobacter bicostacola]UTC24844.1 CDP-alcohol phosphatidyltransferase family protein [Candidatus Comchoanobacter bicostacola]